MTSINALMTERSKKHVASCSSPSEVMWAKNQPAKWQDACMMFALASNTRGGVVGKSLACILREGNKAGIPMSSATFQRHVSVLQAYGLIYQDKFRPFQHQDDWVQDPSTWLLRLDLLMPRAAKLTGSARWHRMTTAQWLANPTIDGHRVTVAPRWQDSPGQPPF